MFFIQNANDLLMLFWKPDHKISHLVMAAILEIRFFVFFPPSLKKNCEASTHISKSGNFIETLNDFGLQ